MNTTRKGGPDSKKPEPLLPDDPRLQAFAPGPLSEETKKAIAAHRARFLELRAQRAGDVLAADPADGPVTVVVEGQVVIRPLRDSRFSEGAVSGMMPLDGATS